MTGPFSNIHSPESTEELRERIADEVQAMKHPTIRLFAFDGSEYKPEHVDLQTVDPGSVTVIVHVMVYGEPRPFVRTAESFFVGPKFHIEERYFSLKNGIDGPYNGRYFEIIPPK